VRDDFNEWNARRGVNKRHGVGRRIHVEGERTVEIAERFGGKNITDFLATYWNEMKQRDVNDLKQISSFKRVVEPGIRERIIEIQNEHATWAEFEKALLAEYMLEDASRMTRHTLMNWMEKKGKNLCASGV
jgi:dephospho-CoA kinase